MKTDADYLLFEYASSLLKDFVECVNYLPECQQKFILQYIENGDWEQAYNFYKYVASYYKKPVGAKVRFGLAYLHIMKMGKLSYKRRIR